MAVELRDLEKSTPQTLAFWNFVPEDERTAQCPDYLLNMSDKDKRILGSWDADFMTIPWDGEDGARDLVRKFSRFLLYASNEHSPVNTPSQPSTVDR